MTLILSFESNGIFNRLFDLILLLLSKKIEYYRFKKLSPIKIGIINTLLSDLRILQIINLRLVEVSFKFMSTNCLLSLLRRTYRIFYLRRFSISRPRSFLNLA